MGHTYNSRPLHSTFRKPVEGDPHTEPRRCLNTTRRHQLQIIFFQEFSALALAIETRDAGCACPRS